MAGAKRDITMDALKGVAIVLVVLGHAVQFSYVYFDANPLFRLIYAFHMPLFMFISGYIAFYGRDNWSWGQLRKKVLLLVLPFAAWYAVSYVATGAYLTTGLKSYFGLVVLSPDRGLWFLWVLFLNFVGLALALRLERWLRWAAIPAVWLGLLLVPGDAFGLSLARWYFGFFGLGFLVHRHADMWWRYRRWLGLVGVVGFGLLVPFWWRTINPEFAPALAAWLNPIHLHQLDLLILELYRYAVPILGIMASWAVVSLMPRLTPMFYRALCWLGLYTMDIYVTHQYFVRFGMGTGVVHIVTGAMVGLGVSLLISFGILRRNEVLAHIFLGKPYPGRNRAEAEAGALEAGPDGAGASKTSLGIS